MKLHHWAAAVAFALMAGGASGAGPAPGAGFLYLMDYSPANLHGYAVDAAGQVTAIGGLPLELPGGDAGDGRGNTLAWSAKTGFLFAATRSGLNVLGVAADGTLSLLPGPAFLPTSPAKGYHGVALVEGKGGTFVYTCFNSSFPEDAAEVGIHGFRVGSDGSLTSLGGTLPGGTGASTLASIGTRVFADLGASIAGSAAGPEGLLVEAAASPLAKDLPGLQLSPRPVPYPDPRGKWLYESNATSAPINGEAGTIVSYKPGKDGSLKVGKAGPYSGRNPDWGGGLALSKKSVCVAISGFSSGTQDLEPLKKLGNGSFKPVGEVQDSHLGSMHMGVMNATGTRLFVQAQTTVASLSVNQKTGAIALLDTPDTGSVISLVRGMIFVER